MFLFNLFPFYITLHYLLFIVHHILCLVLIYIGYNQNFGTSIYIIFETTSPLLNITKISKYLGFNCKILKTITKNTYFLFRVVTPPIWIVYKLQNSYNHSWAHVYILSQITIIWLSSIVWWRKMKG